MGEAVVATFVDGARVVGTIVVGTIVGAGVYETWKSMESVTEASPSHVSVSVYSFTVASPETTCVTWPSLSKMSAVWTTLPSGSVKTAVKVAQALESPRYTQRSSHSTSWTHVEPVPMLEICKKEAVGTIVGRALGDGDGGADGVALGEADGVALGVELGDGDGAALGEGDGPVLGRADGTALGQLLDGIIVGAGEYDTWKSMESVNVASSSHVSDSVYSFTATSPGTTCVSWPSLSTVSVRTSLPSGSVKTAVKVAQAPESPR